MLLRGAGLQPIRKWEPLSERRLTYLSRTQIAAGDSGSHFPVPCSNGTESAQDLRAGRAAWYSV